MSWIKRRILSWLGREGGFGVAMAKDPRALLALTTDIGQCVGIYASVPEGDPLGVEAIAKIERLAQGFDDWTTADTNSPKGSALEKRVWEMWKALASSYGEWKLVVSCLEEGDTDAAEVVSAAVRTSIDAEDLVALYAVLDEGCGCDHIVLDALKGMEDTIDGWMEALDSKESCDETNAIAFSRLFATVTDCDQIVALVEKYDAPPVDVYEAVWRVVGSPAGFLAAVTDSKLSQRAIKPALETGYHRFEGLEGHILMDKIIFVAALQHMDVCDEPLRHLNNTAIVHLANIDQLKIIVMMVADEPLAQLAREAVAEREALKTEAVVAA